MKTFAPFLAFSAAVSAVGLEALGCASPCVSKIALVDGCAQSDMACHCSKAGVIKQLQPCMESACTEANTFEKAAEAFTQACSSAGVVVRFSPIKVRRMDGMPGMSSSSGAPPTGHEGMNMAGMSAGSNSPAPAPAPGAGASSAGSSGSQGMAGMSGHQGMAGMGASSISSSSSAVIAGASSPAAYKPTKAYSKVSTTAGAKPAKYTGAAAPREVGGGLLGVAAALAVAAI